MIPRVRFAAVLALLGTLAVAGPAGAAPTTTSALVPAAGPAPRPVVVDHGTLELGNAQAPARLTQKKGAAKTKPKKGELATPGTKGITQAPSAKAPDPPAPVPIGSGEHPDVLVDAAGTAHVVWNEDVVGAQPDVTHYCRLPRGATACTNPNGTPMPITNAYASDDGGPRIFQLGNQLLVLTHRYPSIVKHPDDRERDRTTFAFTSSDGGTTWTGPGIVGTTLPSGDAALIPGATPKIAVITDRFTPGTFVQLIDPGKFSAAAVPLGGSADAYDGTVAPDGDGVIAAFGNAQGNTVTVRRVGGGPLGTAPPAAASEGQPAPADGSATNPGLWSTGQLAGELPRLASGPRGTFLLTRDATPNWNVRSVTGAAIGGATQISSGPITQERDLFQDASGRLLAAFSSQDARAGVTLKQSVDGATSWDGGFPVAAANAIDQLSLGAAADGGGVLIHRRDPEGTFTGTIAASGFGTLSPTGQLGAGDLPGAGIPGGFIGCLGSGFGDVAIEPKAGCLLESTDAAFPGAVVSRGEVDLNGLVLVPEAGVSIVFDPRKRTLLTTGKVAIVLRGPGIGDIELARATLRLQLGSKTGESLFKGIDLPAGPKIKGFPIDADFDIKIDGKGVAIPVSLKLPPALGGISASATLRATRGSGARLESFGLGAKAIPLGPVAIEDLLISYDGSAERWSGGAKVKLPLGTLQAQVVFENGRFVRGSFDLQPGRPGILVFKESYFTGVSGSLSLDPTSIEAGASFGFGYAPPPVDLFTAEVKGSLKLTIDQGAAQFLFTGTGYLFGAKIGTQKALVTTDGLAKFNGDYDLDLSVVAFEGGLEAFADGRTKQFGGTFNATFRIAEIPISGGKGAVSNKGVGGCVRLPPFPGPPFFTTESTWIGAGYLWGGKARILPPGDECDLGDYTIPAPATGARLQATAPGARSFRLPGGLRAAAVEVTGDGGAPAVDVITPSGQRIPATAPATDPRVKSLTLAGSSTTVVALERPASGAWQVVARDGSPAISGIAVAQRTRAPKASGQITRRGSVRTLRYRVDVPQGAQVRLIETFAGGARGLGKAKKGQATLRIPPGGGPGGRRTVFAIPERRDGVPGAPLRLASYTAPAPRRPATVAGIVPKGSTVRWRKVAGAKDYLVSAELADGRVVLITSRKGAASAKVPGATKANAVVRAKVAARDADGRLGRYGSGKAKK